MSIQISPLASLGRNDRDLILYPGILVPEKSGDTAEERAAALLAGRHGRGGIQGRSRFLAKNHLKPFIDNALDFLA